MAGLSIKADGGGEFNAYIARPDKTRAPCIVVIQEIFGVTPGMRAICDGFAMQGYVAVCPDLFWRQKPGVQLNDKSEKEFDQAMAYMQGFDFMKGIADLKSTLAQARQLEGSSGKAGVVGYCMGGSLAYMMACFSDSDASVGYYPVQIDQHLGHADLIKKPLMLHIAEKDAFCPPEAQRKITEALSKNKHIVLHGYPGVDHAFARQGGEHYDAVAAELANKRTADFFSKALN